MTDVPTTRYTKSGDFNIAYQVVGEGNIDLVFVSGWVSHLEVDWEGRHFVRFLRRLASFSRIIRFDKRGTGMSDRVDVHNLPTLEKRIDDVQAVMDAVGSERAALFGMSEGGPMSVLFSASHPERTTALILCGTAATVGAGESQSGVSRERLNGMIRLCEEQWGGPVMADVFTPSMTQDAEYLDWFAKRLRMGASPGAATGYIRMNFELDVRHVLPAVRVPTLVLHRIGDRIVPLEAGRYLASCIPGARLVELTGDDHVPWVGETEPVIGEIEEFLTGVRRGVEDDRVLATVLFTDIVSSTERAGQLGDRGWKDLLDKHDEMARRHVERFRGRVVKFTGDGVLATFDGPARAVRCAAALRDAVGDLGVDVRAGAHG
jgi:pimeloyl-ACP methyl ester carboxylesterase